MRLPVLIVLLMCGLLASANDTHVVGASGRVRRVDGEHATVRMVREWVKMDVHPEYYDVAAQFVFHNDGPATTVQMGFPEGGTGDISREYYSRHTGFLSFATWLDGQKVRAERLPLENLNEDEYAYDTYWVKTVAFARDQTRIVRVEYRSPIHGDSLGVRWVAYNFTGGNWAGVVEESNLQVTLHLSGAYVIDPHIPMAHRGNQLSFRWTNWQAEHGFDIDFIPVRADAMLIRGFPAYPLSVTSDHSRIIQLPGKGPAPIGIPPAIMKEGTAFIKVSDLTQYLSRRAHDAGHQQEDLPRVRWEANTRTGTLTVGAHTLTFVLRQPIMLVKGAEQSLPAAPFLSTPIEHFGEQSSRLYVPLRPVIEVLGGTVTEVNMAERWIAFSIPWWGDGPEINPAASLPF